jgi:hypothetical protein
MLKYFCSTKQCILKLLIYDLMGKVHIHIETAWVRGKINLNVFTRSLQGILKGGSIAVLLTSCLTGLDKSVLQIKTKIVSCCTADSKPVKQEVNGTVILPPLLFHNLYYT